MRNAIGHQYKKKMCGCEKSEQERVRNFLHKKRVLEVSRWIHAKQLQRNVQKSVLHVQKFPFAN